ncbi:class I SAM-dependent methyltransferase [Chryseobacterium koreense]
MEITGERHVLTGDFSNLAEYYNHLMHLATYQYAEKFIAGKKVLNFGCGSGYGSSLLSKAAQSVIGADISREAVDFANEKYAAKNLSFRTINEIGGEKFDAITSFQVIEHVSNYQEYVKTLKKLLKPDRILLISTPDRENRLYSFQQPWNIFHLKEYSGKSLKNALTKEFKQVKILKMTAEKDLVMSEISRTLKQKKITLPSTLPFYPNFLRVFLLKLQSNIFEKVKRAVSKSPKSTGISQNSTPDFIQKYSVNNIKFEENPELSTDLLAICSHN